MLLDLIDKLIDRTIQLVTTDKEHRKELVERFVEPVFAQFEKVHQDYLASFRQYRDLLAKPEADRAAIIETIRRDHLFTADQRTKLKTLARGAKDTAVASFVKYIHLYLTSPDFYGTQPVIRPIGSTSTPASGGDRGYCAAWRAGRCPRPRRSLPCSISSSARCKRCTGSSWEATAGSSKSCSGRSVFRHRCRRIGR